MRLYEIAKIDNSIWKLISNDGSSFYIDFEDLKRRHMLLSSAYDRSTNRKIVDDNIKDLNSMKSEILKMYTFCKNSRQDTETDEFLKSLKLMYNGCKSMIEELEKF